MPGGAQAVLIPLRSTMPFLPFVLLASSSPRRRQLVRQMGADHAVLAPEVIEEHFAGESPEALVERLSLAKVEAAMRSDQLAEALDGRSDAVVLGSDTVVVLDEHVLGKPTDEAEARAMLHRLSGRAHVVFTGYALIDLARNERVVGHERTDVTFRTLDAEEIERYVASGSPLDKAGAYGIQDDFGAVFIERINGDYYTVMGLPLSRVYTELRRMGGAR